MGWSVGRSVGRLDSHIHPQHPSLPHGQNVKATMVDRVGSWDNYAALFTALIEDGDGCVMKDSRDVMCEF